MKVARAAVSFLLVAVAATAQTSPRQPRRFDIVPPERPRCIEQQDCTIQLRTSDGVAPFQWRVSSGDLPKGLELDRNTGKIAGTPTQAGVTTVVVTVTDRTAYTAQLRITITIVSLLEIEWRSVPGMRDTNLGGSLHVINHSGNDVMLTVIVVAVNEIHKAFALGYQNFTLAAGATSPDIPFSMQMPPGRYGVRADAVGEVAPKNIIYRSALEAGPYSTP
jgi:hypothetical protein